MNSSLILAWPWASVDDGQIQHCFKFCNIWESDGNISLCEEVYYCADDDPDHVALRVGSIPHEDRQEEKACPQCLKRFNEYLNEK